jgi:hypothetical protein
MMLNEGKDFAAINPPHKYRTVRKLTISTRVKPPEKISLGADRGRVVLEPDGTMVIAKDFKWDGPSSITVDTPDWMEASLVHDVGYWAIREGALPMRYRRKYDKEMRRILKRDKMPFFRRFYSWAAVRIGGEASAEKRRRQ